ncbi:MAG TPA: hypothetical protein VFF43_15565, partial [Caldimonas sp.]|nr:hypothetical protein [Caldimonas sp.]
MLDSKQHEARKTMTAARAAGERHASLARFGREGELRRPAGGIDARQRVVIGAEHIEQIVPDAQITHAALTGKLDDQRDARDARRCRRHRAAPRRAPAVPDDDTDLVADRAEKALA